LAQKLINQKGADQQFCCSTDLYLSIRETEPQCCELCCDQRKSHVKQFYKLNKTKITVYFIVHCTKGFTDF